MRALVSGPKLSAADCCSFAYENMGLGYTYLKGGALPPYPVCPAGEHCCVVFAEVAGSYANATSAAAAAASARLEKRRTGECRYLKAVTGRSHQAGAVSGGSSLAPPARLYPSWPASSPWVTAVGATRFEAQSESPSTRTHPALAPTRRRQQRTRTSARQTHCCEPPFLFTPSHHSDSHPALWRRSHRRRAVCGAASVLVGNGTAAALLASLFRGALRLRVEPSAAEPSAATPELPYSASVS